ncbi:MAG TPA: plastocyanin/azurin family copper-binding protein [Actinomycetota bacterium]
MNRNGGVRRGIGVAALALLGTLLLSPVTASASGGGGCGKPVTDEAGSAVTIRDYCFSPTVLRVAVGETVTFTNRDRAPHTVLGANGTWGGYDVLRRKSDPMTYRFSDSGVYPYVCTYHPGMVAAIVVGDGSAGASVATTAAGPVTLVTSPAADVQPIAVAPPPRTNAVTWSAIVIGAAVLLGAGGAIAIRRKRQRADSLTG